MMSPLPLCRKHVIKILQQKLADRNGKKKFFSFSKIYTQTHNLHRLETTKTTACLRNIKRETFAALTIRYNVYLILEYNVATTGIRQLE